MRKESRFVGCIVINDAFLFIKLPSSGLRGKDFLDFEDSLREAMR